MTTHKRKKVGKYRGSKTHGGGAMKKRRGAGHRGGRGMAGTGKREDVKKPSIWGDTKYFGKYGFLPRKNAKPQKKINIKDLEVQTAGIEKGKVISIDLASQGYDKLLGSGKPSKKYMVTVDSASAGAIEKIAATGGAVTVRIVSAPAEREKGAEGAKKTAAQAENKPDKPSNEKSAAGVAPKKPLKPQMPKGQ